MKRIVLSLVLISNVAMAQHDTLSLFHCFDAVEANHPGSQQKALIDQQTLLKLKNLTTQWYPSVDLSARATYQSDIARIDVDLPFDANFPSPSKDQYQVTLEMGQMIYDGGAVEASRYSEKVEEQVGKQSVEVDLHEVKAQVLEVYFGIMLLEKQKSILQATMDELAKKRKTVQSAVEHGTLLPSDLKTIRAEQLDLQQNLEEVELLIRSSYRILRVLTGLEVSGQTSLALPPADTSASGGFQRPENALFAMKSKQLEASRELVKTRRMPKILAFGRFGYGKPGLNMLGDEFDTFYIVGARLSWNIWDWGRNKRERQVLKVGREKVAVQERAFNEGLRVQLARIESEIQRYQKAAERDRKIIRLRREVTESARSKLENGVITSSDYLSELNQLTKARITQERHRIALQKARISYLFTKGIIQ